MGTMAKEGQTTLAGLDDIAGAIKTASKPPPARGRPRIARCFRDRVRVDLSFLMTDPSIGADRHDHCDRDDAAALAPRGPTGR
jgi:hypothetical protein